MTEGGVLLTLRDLPDGSSTTCDVTCRSPTCFCTKEPMKAPKRQLREIEKLAIGKEQHRKENR
jgi:hypothetical protein